MTNPVKEIYQKHGITKPCPACNDNHVPTLEGRDQRRRCNADLKHVCVCCKACSVKCDGSVLRKEGVEA